MQRKTGIESTATAIQRPVHRNTQNKNTEMCKGIASVFNQLSSVPRRLRESECIAPLMGTRYQLHAPTALLAVRSSVVPIVQVAM